MNNLTAAAKRLMDSGNFQYWDGNGGELQPQADAQLLASEYLHLATQSEPITPEWLKEHGWVFGWEQRWRIESDTWGLAWKEGDSVRLVVNCGEIEWPRPITTKG